MGEQGKLDVEERAFADAANDGGHAVSGVNVTAWLRAIVAVQDDHGIAYGGRQRGEFGVDFKIAQGFADLFQAGNFFKADRDTFKVAFEDGNSIAVGANAEPCVDEAGTVPFAQKLLRLGLHLFFLAADERNDIGVDVHGSNAGITRAGDGLQCDSKNLFQAKSVREWFQDEDKTAVEQFGLVTMKPVS